MIRYHGTRLSGDRLVTVRSMQAKHCCVSFADQADMPILAEVCSSFMLDNGAFTAWKQRKNYDPKDFLEWLSDWAFHPGHDFYCIPDIIDGTEQDNKDSLTEWEKMAGKKIFSLGSPVWHMHESIDYLRYLCENFSRVCIGSSGEFSEIGTQEWWFRISQAMDAICDDTGRPITRLHGLRQLSAACCSRIPYSSADSTNVARNIGIDSAWSGTYIPKSREVRAAIMMERIESHATASNWSREYSAVQENLSLFG